MKKLIQNSLEEIKQIIEINLFGKKINVSVSRILFWTIVFSFLIRFAMIDFLGYSRIMFGDEISYLCCAQNVITEMTMKINGNHTASLSPVIVILNILPSLIFDDLASVRFFSIFFSSILSIVLFYYLSRCFFQPKESLISTILFSLYFPIAFASVINMPQTHGVLWVMLLLILFYKKDKIDVTSAKAFLFGMYFGLSALLITMLTVFGLIPMFMIVRGKKRLLFFILGFMIFLSPWVIRNYITFRKPILLTTNMWMNIWSGNCQHSTALNGAYPLYRTTEGRSILKLDEFEQIKEFKKRDLCKTP